MNTIFDYLTWRGDISFSEVALTEIDGLILVAFSYLTPPEKLRKETNYTLMDLQKCVENESQVEHRNEQDFVLLKQLAESKRFASIKVLNFFEQTDTQKEMQFAAYCLELAPQKQVIVYRGTDHSITGWKEDFNLSFLDQIPGQQYALKYLTRMMDKQEGEFYICGHSKGGNLGVFAATTCTESYASRILEVYNYDGPGFSADFIKQPSYEAMLSRLHTFLPESSIVGLLFEHEEPFEIVESTNVGITQHEPYSWSVLGSSIIRAENRSSSSYVLDHAIHNWLASMDVEQRRGFVEALFGLLEETDATSIEEILSPKNVLLAGKHFKAANEEERLMLSQAMSLFSKAVSDSVKSRRSEKPRLTSPSDS